MNPGERGRKAGQTKSGQQGRPAGRPAERKQPPRPAGHKPKFNPEDMFDLHLRIGIEDHKIRVSKRDYGRLVQEWKIGGLDVILRAVLPNHERNIILRGCEGGYESVFPCDPDKHIPVYNVMSVLEMRRKMLSDQGVE